MVNWCAINVAAPITHPCIPEIISAVLYIQGDQKLYAFMHYNNNVSDSSALSNIW